jgi:hypothetical protein
MIIGAGAVTWKLLFQPAREQAQEEAIAKEKLLEAEKKRQRDVLGGSPSRYKHTVNFHLDSFSGYAILRSDSFKKNLGKAGIGLVLKDDGADYTSRLAALKSGDAQMASFTIDALIKTSSQMNDLPATIIALIDERQPAQTQ